MTSLTIKDFDTAMNLGATNKGAVSKMVKAWEAKNDQRVKRAAGLGLMAVSLAACGGADDDTPTVTVSQMLATDDLPASYNISIASADLGAVTVAQFANFSAEAQAALNVLEYVAAVADGGITLTYSIADTAAAIIAAGGNFGDVDVVVTGDPTLSIADLEALEEIGATFSGSVTVSDSAANILASSADLSDAAIVVTDTSLTPAQVAALEALTATFGTVTVQQALTTNTDTFVGTSLNDVITADFENGLNKFSANDTLNGGAGTDTLNITTIANYTDPTGATVTGIENANITANGSVTANTSAWTGLTALNSTAVGDADLTAAATTNVVSNVSAVGTGTLTVVGGNNVTVNATGLASTGANGTITVGTVAAGVGVGAAGNVVVNASGTAAGSTIGTITVHGGDTITINQTASNAANTTQQLGIVTVTGDAGTTAVTVNNAAAAALAASVVGVSVGGAVTITDAADATNLLADTMSTVSLSNFGATNIDSSALTTLNVTGGSTSTLASGLIDLDSQSGVAPATVLTINSAGGFMGAIDTVGNANYTTINVNSSAATTIADLTTAATTTATLNFTGTGATTFTDNSLHATLVDINVNGIGGVNMGTTALAAGTDFDGNEGADSIVITGASTRDITMGGGNDTVTLNTIGADGFDTATVANAGSLSGGAGTDTIVMVAADAVLASSTGAFNADVTGFETLRLSDALAANAVLDVDGINNVNRVELAGSAAASVTNLDSNGTIALGAALTGVLTVGVQSAVAGTADVLNLELNAVTATNFGTVAAANVETINISAADANALTGSAVRHTVALTGSTNLTSIAVSGNNGVTVTGVATVTNFDASGVVANDASDTAARLAVSYTSSNNTAADLVRITGGEGNDTLAGNSALDTINGGAGDDTITGGAGADTLTGGDGTDTVSYADVTTATSHALTAISGMAINLSGATVTAADIATAMGGTIVIGGGAGVAGADLASGSAGYLATTAGGSLATMVRDTVAGFENVTGSGLGDFIVGSAGANVIDGAGGADTITGGAGADTLTGGGGGDTFVFADGASGLTLATADTITEFTTGVDFIDLDGYLVASAATDYSEADGSAAANFDALVVLADAAFANDVGDGVHVLFDALGTGDAYVFFDASGNGSFGAGDTLIILTGVAAAGDIIAADFL